MYSVYYIGRVAIIIKIAFVCTDLIILDDKHEYIARVKWWNGLRNKNNKHIVYMCLNDNDNVPM